MVNAIQYGDKFLTTILKFQRLNKYMQFFLRVKCIKYIFRKAFYQFYYF